MSEKQLDNVLKFSKLLVPPSWHPLLVGDERSLCFIGTENLQAMLFDWELLLKSCKLALKAAKKLDMPACRCDFYARSIKNAKHAIPVLERLIPNSESKPVFATHRRFDAFKAGDKVFVCMGDDETGEADPFVPVVVSREHDVDSVYFKMGKGKKAFTADIHVCSPYILSEADAKYLSENPYYLAIFSRMGDLDDDAEVVAYEELVFGCGRSFFPGTVPKISAVLPNILFATQIHQEVYFG